MAHGLYVAAGVLAARILVEELVVHVLADLAERVRLVALKLADDDLLLLRELPLVEALVLGLVAHEAHRDGEVRRGRREVVLDDLFLRLPVVDDAERVNVLQVVGLLRALRVDLEEHVLVEVRQAVQLRRLGERAVAHGQLYRDERNRVVFEHDDFKPVRQNTTDERRGLGYRPGGRLRCRAPLRRGLLRCRARLLP